MSTVDPIGPSPRRRRYAHPVLLVGYGLVCGALAALLPLPSWTETSDAIDRLWAMQVASPVPRGERWHVEVPVCVGPTRVTCVVDGDTIWLDGEKIRLSTFNSPEMNGICRRERQLARKAQRRLSALLSSAPFGVERHGTDVYDRTLARVNRHGGEIGPIMVAEGLAHRWQGYRRDWC